MAVWPSARANTTSAQVPVKCCGEEMHVLEAGVTDAAQEKHVPAVTAEGQTAKAVYAYCNLHGLWKKDL